MPDKKFQIYRTQEISMKKYAAILSMLLAAVLMTATAFAQDTTTDTTVPVTAPAKKVKGARVPDARLTELSTTLNLTDDQKAKIKPILDDETTKMHAVRKDATLSKDDQKSKSKAIRTDSDAQIRALLTPDQQKTFDASSKKSGEKSKKHEAPDAAPAPPTA